MKKQRKQFIILLAALVLLAAAIPGVRYLNGRREAKEAEAAAAEQDSVVVIDAAYEDVVKFSYDYDGETYAFEKTGDTWHAAEDDSLKLKEYSIKNMLSGVTPFDAQQVIENVTDLSQYGLAEPERTISFETAGASYILNVGDHNALTGTCYVCMPSETTVYVVEQTVVTRFNQTLEDVVETEEEESVESQSGDEGASQSETEGEGAGSEGGESQSEAEGEGAGSEGGESQSEAEGEGAGSEEGESQSGAEGEGAGSEEGESQSEAEGEGADSEENVSRTENDGSSEIQE